MRLSALSELREQFADNLWKIDLEKARQCNAEDWPVGHALLNSVSSSLIGRNIFYNHYKSLAHALEAAEAAASYLQVVPGDLRSIIRAHFRTESTNLSSGLSRISYVSKFMSLWHSYNDIPNYVLQDGALEWAEWYKYREFHRPSGPHGIQCYPFGTVLGYKSDTSATPGYKIEWDANEDKFTIRKFFAARYVMKSDDYVDGEILKTTKVARQHAGL